jgi:hypothetical protein
MHGDEKGAAGWLIDFDNEIFAFSEPGPDRDERFNLVHSVFIGDNFDEACWVWGRIARSALI